MQSSLLPTSVCKRLDQINRNFLWGGSAEATGNHLVSWDRVCTKKDRGGLGLRKARNYNLAMLAKVGWKLHNRTDSLWYSIFQSKYLHHDDFLNCGVKSNSSSTWKGLLQTRDGIRRGIRWQVGNGNTIKFWSDWWVGTGPLIHFSTHDMESLDVNMKVNAVLDATGNWDLHRLQTLLPPDLVEEVRAIPLMLGQPGVDLPYWGFTRNGDFNVSSAYEVVSKTLDVAVGDIRNTKWIWQLRCPERVRFFVWLLFHDKLNTNEKRVKKGMATSAACCFCMEAVESIQHVLMECPFALEVWPLMVGNGNLSSFLNKQFHDWVKSNSILSTSHDSSIDGCILFVCILWSLWKCRNFRIFEGKCCTSHEAYTYAYKLSRDITLAWSHKSNHVTKQPSWVKWECSSTSMFTLNTDGAVKNGTGRASTGGLIRNDKGDWLRGFMINIGRTDSLRAELWGVREGLKLAKEMGLRNLTLQTDAAMAVTLLKTEVHLGGHPLGTLLDDCKRLIDSFTDLQIKHVFREANKCADKLANIAQGATLGVTVLDVPPVDISQLLNANALGITYLRV
ncbi:hypothetical protein REPUB_Repub08aG0157600 [Reevesia pubescens]